MFYHIFTPLGDVSIIFNVFRYVTFRSIAAFITALLFSIIFGPVFIRMLKKHQVVEAINDDVPSCHKVKQGTPTMGGLIILSGLLLSSFLWNNLTNTNILIMYLVALWLGGLGFLDDYFKNIKKMKSGLIAKYKLAGQVSLSLIVVFTIYFTSYDPEIVTRINLPFLKDTAIQLGWFFIPFVIFMVVGTSNAVNLTDGLDGLAAGCIAVATFAIGAMAYIKGNINHATYLQLDFIREAGELSVFTSAIIGTILGFLWYNTKPAQIFMGDTGSLALGGLLATLSILIKEEVFFAIVGGIFVIETLSTIIQRYFFKYTKKKYGEGRRVFLCAPIHHHFEKKGWSEEKIVIRFWIITVLLAALGFATIKLR